MPDKSTIIDINEKLELLKSLHLNSEIKEDLEYWEQRTAFSWLFGGTPFRIQKNSINHDEKWIYRIPDGVAHLMYVARNELYTNPSLTVGDFANRLDQLRMRMVIGESRWRDPDTTALYENPIRYTPTIAAAPAIIAPPPVAATTSAPKSLNDFQGRRFSYNDFEFQNALFGLVSSQIGKGSFSQIFKVKHKKTNTILAIKQVELVQNKKDCEKFFLAEIHALAKTNHPNIVKLYGIYSDDPKGISTMVLEFVNGDNLAVLLSVTNIDWKKREILIYDLTKAVEHLHTKRIIHRDIKPANLLVTSNMRLKLCDLGFASDVDNVEEFLGTPIYAAPEFLDGKPNMSEADYYACDMYSVGATVYQIITRQKPPEPALKSNQYRGKGLFEIGEGGIMLRLDNKGDGLHCPSHSMFMKEIVVQCCKYSAPLRPTATNVLKIIEANISAPPPPAPAPQLTIT